jgi:hypothetical protein
MRRKRRSSSYDDEHHILKSKIRSELGVKTEERVEKILKDLVKEGEFDGYKRFRHFSREDLNGKDFAVIKNGKRWYFGVTISLRRAIKMSRKHPSVPTIWVWEGISDEKIANLIRYITIRFQPE